MPKVYLSEKERLCTRLARWVYGEMKVRRISQRTIAEKMDISQPALNRKLREASFDYSDFVFFVKEFQPDNKELREIIGI